MSIIIASSFAAVLCFEATGRVEAWRATNGGLRPILWQR